MNTELTQSNPGPSNIEYVIECSWNDGNELVPSGFVKVTMLPYNNYFMEEGAGVFAPSYTLVERYIESFNKGNKVTVIEYLPDCSKDTTVYEPGDYKKETNAQES